MAERDLDALQDARGALVLAHRAIPAVRLRAALITDLHDQSFCFSFCLLCPLFVNNYDTFFLSVMDWTVEHDVKLAYFA